MNEKKICAIKSGFGIKRAIFIWHVQLKCSIADKLRFVTKFKRTRGCSLGSLEPGTSRESSIDGVMGAQYCRPWLMKALQKAKYATMPQPSAKKGGGGGVQQSSERGTWTSPYVKAVRHPYKKCSHYNNTFQLFTASNKRSSNYVYNVC